MNIRLASRIAQEEWRYWLRTKTGLAATVVVVLLAVASAVTTFVRVESERETTIQLQTLAEDTFRNQPARHPHRMVHYGHYVFRAPTPLAVADPGVDPYTGTVMFLEGHRQNSATFSPQYSRAQAGAYAALTPALTYQLMVPLLLIVVGFSTMSREQEAKTNQLIYTMAVSPATLWAGKSIALAGLSLVTLLPLAAVVLQAWANGEAGMMALTLWCGYTLYLLCWVCLVTMVSVWTRQAVVSLFALLVCWVVLCLLMPRLASSAAEAWAPLDSKVHNDLEIARVLREVGDGHNANDPAFASLRAQVLAQYGVDSIDALPVNFRGLVAQASEAELTEILNQFAKVRQEQELAQRDIANKFSLVSPYLALKSFSVISASTDLTQQHRFMREAEALRFSFVQTLNNLHANELAYEDDINRSVDSQSEQRARIDAHHWRLLEDFEWEPAPMGQRLSQGRPYLGVLLVWLFATAGLGVYATRRSIGVPHA